MKTILNLTILYLIVTSCQVQKEKLSLNLTRGESYSQVRSSNILIGQIINGQQLNMEMNVSGKLSYKVIEITDSVYDMEVKYDSLGMKMNLPGGIMEFSSEKNDEEDIFSSILAKMKNVPFFIKMSKNGKIKEVKNIEALFSNIFDEFPQLQFLQREQIKQQLMQTYGEKAFTGNVEMVSAIFPDFPVSKGDRWVINKQLESEISADVETTYELKDISNSFYQIHGDSKIETANKDEFVESNGILSKYDMSGIMSSDIKIDKSTGWISEAKIKQSLKGNVYVKESLQMPEGMTIPMIMTNEMTITEK